MGSRLISLLVIFSLVAFFSGGGCAEKAEEKETKKAEEVKEAITEEALPQKEMVEEAKELAEETGEAVEKVEEEMESKVEEVKEFVKEQALVEPQKEIVEKAKEVAAEAKTTAVKVPDTIPIHSKVWDTVVNVVGEHEVHGKQYQDFNFNHKKHNVDYKVACTECHHVYQEGKNVWKEGDPVKKCEECHNIVDLTKKKDPMSLYAAFHDNCVGCHKAHMKEWKATGKAAGEPKPEVPVGCTKCHAKKTE